MVGNLKSPYENGLDDETKVALALSTTDAPLRLTEVARKANITKQHAAYALEKLQVRGVVLRDEKPRTWRLQPMFFRLDLGQELYEALLKFAGHAAPYVINPRKDPEVLMHNIQALMRMLAVDLEDKVRV